MEIGVKCEALQDAMAALDRALKNGIAGMIEKKADGCTVTLKIEMESMKTRTNEPITGKAREMNNINFEHECRVGIRFETREKGCCTEKWELLENGNIAKLEEKTKLPI